MQSTFDFSHQVTNKAIQRAVDHVNRIDPEWFDNAFNMFTRYISLQKDSFRTEDFREWAKDSIPTPPTLRVFGALTRKAEKLKLIERVGYTSSSNIKAHRANVSVWKRV